MTIAPIIRVVQVKPPPARAFELFTGRMGAWWPRGGGVGQAPCVDVVIEPRVEGRWFERDADGNETPWGEVLIWDPPSRLVLAWRLNCEWGYDPDLLTEVELTFQPAQDGGTVVTLEHRHLENFGASAAAHAAKLDSGWPTRLADFAGFAATADAAIEGDKP